MKISVKNKYATSELINALYLTTEHAIIVACDGWEDDMIGGLCFKSKPFGGDLIVICNCDDTLYLSDDDLARWPVYCRLLEKGETVTITIQN